MTRREFAAAPLIGAFRAQPGSRLARPMRWLQLAFVEDDPGNYDKGFWLDYIRRIRAEGVCLSAGGCVAFYPTRIPLHYKSRFMKDGQDPFGELVRECRKLGLAILARVDPHAAHGDVFEAHPDWIARDAEGRPRRHWAMPDYWVTCGLGPYNFEFMRDVVREIAERYDIDGIFSNRWSGSGLCWCDHCRRNFRAFAGGDLPRTADRSDPAWIRWREFQNERLFQLWDVLEQAVQSVRPEAAFIPNTGGGAHAEIDMKRAGQRAPFLVADRQARYGLQLAWANGKNAREYRAALGAKPAAGLVSVGLEAPYRWKDSVQQPEEIQLWTAAGIAHGMRPWVTKFNAKPLDSRWFRPVEELFAWHAAHERYFRNEANLARVAIVFSQQTALRAAPDVDDFIRGAFHALIEARIPFEMVHDELLDAERLRPFRTLILPNLAALSDAQCGQLRAFAESGGGIVATHETSLYDETGRRRPDFGLADLFGCSYAGATIARQQNAYIDIRVREHPLLDGLRDAGRFIHGVRRVEITPHGSELPPLTTMPSYPDLPMEEVYVRQPPTRIPAVLCRPFGQGRVAYFPWDIDRTFWEVLSPDHGRLFANAVRWALNEEPVLELEGPGLVDAAVWKQAGSLTVHLVNLTNPYAMKGPIREHIPLPPQRLAVRCPQRPRRARWLWQGGEARFEYRNGALATRTPPIAFYDVLALDL
jgi:hypothetical protein